MTTKDEYVKKVKEQAIEAKCRCEMRPLGRSHFATAGRFLFDERERLVAVFEPDNDMIIVIEEEPSRACVRMAYVWRRCVDAFAIVWLYPETTKRKRLIETTTYENVPVACERVRERFGMACDTKAIKHVKEHSEFMYYVA